MPEEEKKTVDIDTSGPDAEVSIEEPKEENVVETEQQETETENQEQGTDKTYENERETKLEEKDKMKIYDQTTVKVYKLVLRNLLVKCEKQKEEKKRLWIMQKVSKNLEKALETKFSKVNEDYVKKFETRVSTGLEAAQKELAAAIEMVMLQLRLKQIKKSLLSQLMNARLQCFKEGRKNQVEEKPAQTLSEAAAQLQQSAPKLLHQIQERKIGQVKTHGSVKTKP